jgi:succinate dehydrogenase/fumarate reductase cytochrome b subunit
MKKMSELKKLPLRGGCRCGGNCHSGHKPNLAPHELLSLDFSTPKEEGGCACGERACPRQYLAISGFILGGFLLLHLTFNAIGLWPGRFQTLVNLVHGLGAALPVLEMGLVLVLAIHVALGMRTLAREKLTLGVEKHHQGSDARYWLQRVTAVILLLFLSFHLATMPQWGLHFVYQITHWPALGCYAVGGRFVPQHAFASVSQAMSLFWGEQAANPANLLIAEFYLLGIASAIYHLVNGAATGAEVLGFVTGSAQKERLLRWCMGIGVVLATAGMMAWYAFTFGARP